MTIKKKILLFLIIFLPIFVGADFDFSNYRYYKEIKSANVQGKTPYLEIDDDVYINSPLFLADLKIIRDDGREINYTLTKDEDVVKHKVEVKEVKIIRKETNHNGKDELILDLGKEKIFHNKLKVVSDSHEYIREVDIFGSNDREKGFKKLNLKNTREVFSDTLGKQDLFIEYKFNNFRYLKLIIYKKNGDFILKKLLQVFDKVNIQRGDRKYREVKINDINDQKNDGDIYILDAEKEGVFNEKLNLNFLEDIFSRNYILYLGINSDQNCSVDINNCQWKKIHRGKISKNSYEENLSLPVYNAGRFYKLVIEKKNDIKLHLVEAFLESFVQKIYFLDNLDFKKYNYRLYYGSNSAQVDSQKRIIFKKSKDSISLKLGGQKDNPKFINKNDKKENIFLKK